MDLIGWLWNVVVYNPMLNALLVIYNFIPNYGIAIILFTLLIAGLTSPFRIRSQQQMKEQQTKMAALRPKLDELKKKYKDNPQQLQTAQMKLYQEYGVANPFNSGCLLTLLPIPIFMGLYQVIMQVMGDRPEQLMQLAQHLYPNFPWLANLVPVNPNFFGLNLATTPMDQGMLVTIVLVGLVVGSSWVQTKMMAQPAAAMDAQTAQMNSSMQLMTPLLFGFFVLNAPTGLSLYWITFSLVGIVQQYFSTGLGGLESLFNRPAPATASKPKKTAPAVEATPPVTPASENGNTSKPLSSAGGSAPSKGKKKRAKKS